MLILKEQLLNNLLEAYIWYDEHKAGLGAEFDNEFYARLSQIEREPSIGPIVFKDFRRVILQRFPYGLYYRVLDENIIVYSCLHLKQSPDSIAAMIEQSREK